MAGGGRRGPVWRLRRRWAAWGWVRRTLATAGALLVSFLVLGLILGALGVGEEPAVPPVTPPPAVSDSPDPDPLQRPSARPPEQVTPTPTTTPSPASPEPATPSPTQETTTAAPETTSEEPAPDVYYDNCDEARAAGAAPLFRGEPGYAPHLDRDDDGVACEP
ncbi:excalibur calcium-binding domain-containing protein [Streptomyces sp. C10-9-1]|uniref:excalibur calcium-binding domain-containing protein n=1 Tax=Streptomyces sp. C10-9-1 TaxID=1859285 RepID=UPI0021125DBE|nr:excalibur calcium-binding domain-containing protein [Streptomyces sp. C10-9-1]MCQ6553415.1 excalibur calcium-binding domain-containing protein [Streptomyces sp. C10-9-1]